MATSKIVQDKNLAEEALALDANEKIDITKVEKTIAISLTKEQRIPTEIAFVNETQMIYIGSESVLRDDLDAEFKRSKNPRIEIGPERKDEKHIAEYLTALKNMLDIELQ